MLLILLPVRMSSGLIALLEFSLLSCVSPFEWCLLVWLLCRLGTSVISCCSLFFFFFCYFSL